MLNRFRAMGRIWRPRVLEAGGRLPHEETMQCFEVLHLQVLKNKLKKFFFREIEKFSTTEDLSYIIRAKFLPSTLAKLLKSCCCCR